MSSNAPIASRISDKAGMVTKVWANWARNLGSSANALFRSMTLANLTPDRLTASDASKKLVSVEDLTAWIAGTALEVEVTDNLDGTITIGLPNDVSIANDLSVLNDLTVSNDLTVENNGTIENDLFVQNNLDVTMDATIGNNAAITNDLTVGNNATIGNDAIINGDTYLKRDKKLYFDNN